MLSRTVASRIASRVAARRLMSTEAGAAAATVKLNFSLPNETIYEGASVASVIVPGM